MYSYVKKSYNFLNFILASLLAKIRIQESQINRDLDPKHYSKMVPIVGSALGSLGLPHNFLIKN